MRSQNNSIGALSQQLLTPLMDCLMFRLVRSVLNVSALYGLPPSTKQRTFPSWPYRRLMKSGMRQRGNTYQAHSLDRSDMSVPDSMSADSTFVTADLSNNLWRMLTIDAHENAVAFQPWKNSSKCGPFARIQASCPFDTSRYGGMVPIIATTVSQAEFYHVHGEW